MHVLKLLALIVLSIYLLPIVAAGALLFVMLFFPNAITQKGEDSRLIRWPKAIKEFLRSIRDDFSNIFYALRVFFDPEMAKRVLREIESRQPELPLES